ncbi:hypothetical protein [Pelagicoccus sp. SDUM812002]|uniref:hypothetical protein n=1 Tax=Pelagicoccus sp. SDUM812002 TaxID=3041266 RepID=UPI00280F8C64|nr:hypothetical protein [Pelagicoccus sp. SDUM812002]MDQ8188532.1 hypothetical protein [Pelagicoccus sp. SDUM812002]
MKKLITLLLSLFALSANSYGDNYKSISITSESETKDPISVDAAFSEVHEFLSDSAIWVNEEKWNKDNAIPKIKELNESEVSFMSGLKNRKDMISLKKTHDKMITLSAIIENKNEFQTNDIEESLRMIEKIMKKHFPNTTAITQEYKKDLIANKNF